MTAVELNTDLYESKKLCMKEFQVSEKDLAAELKQIIGNTDLTALLNDPNKLFTTNVETNTIITGNVISKTTENILVDYGAKIEAILPYYEDGFNNEDLDVGDTAYFLVIDVDDNGIAKLTRKDVDILVHQQQILAQLKLGDQVRAVLKTHTKNGWIVDIAGLPSFLPSHQEYLVYPSEGAGPLVGCEIDVEIESIIERQVIVTRKAFASEIKKKAKKNFLNSLNVGDLVDGTVKNKTEFGIFIQIAAGIIGLCHSSDQGADDLKVGQKVKARVLKIDREKNRVSLGIRQVTEPSWVEIVAKYNIDDKVIARVKSIVPYGAFLEIEPGVSGLVHVSDLSWSDHVKHPKDILSEGQQVEVVILGVDVDKQHLSLGLKQVTPDPWESITDKYLIGSIVDGVVVNKTKFGIFVEIEKGVEGLAHHTVSSKNLKLGEKVTCSVGRIDLEKKKISLAFEE